MLYVYVRIWLAEKGDEEDLRKAGDGGYSHGSENRLLSRARRSPVAISTSSPTDMLVSPAEQRSAIPEIHLARFDNATRT